LLVLLAGESCKKYLFRSNKKNKKNDLKKHALYVVAPLKFLLI